MPAVDRRFVGLGPHMGWGSHACQGFYHAPAGSPPPKTAFIAAHYNVDFSEHYLAELIAARGFGFLGFNTRFRGLESHFLLEPALEDLDAAVAWLREHGAETIVLLGNSGGGSLLAAYQAEHGGGDLYLSVAAHPGRPDVLTNWMDPSVLDERDPVPTDPELDMFNPENGPPYSEEFLARYREAQRARNRRITEWAEAEIGRLHGAGFPDRLFTLQRVWADPRMVDPALDPSDRPTPACYAGDPKHANRGVFNIGTQNTLRTWLSMWSLDRSDARGEKHLAKIELPALVVQATMDTGVFPSDARQIHDALASPDKALVELPGDHYFRSPDGARDRLADTLAEWVAGARGTLARVDDPFIGTEIAGCRIEAVAGRGGMGVVYRATELRLDRPVALKLIAADRARDPAFRERFEREARMAAAIDHPHVIPVYAAGDDDGHLYIEMRWVAGTDLQRVLREEGALRPERAALIVDQVAQALDASHAAGLVHRDVKPANVLLAADHVYLTDFGITREVDAATVITDGNEWLGTVDFMSVEQLRGERTDPRSDVYALGCLLYAALAGEPPFRRATVAATIKAHLDDLPPRPSLTSGVPEAFDAVVARALAKDPADRFASAGDLGRAALAAAAGESLTIPVSSVAHGEAATTRIPRARTGTDPSRARPGRRRRRRRAPLVLAVLVLAAAAALAIALTSGGSSTKTGPLTSAEVARVARSFARAYGREDARALGRLLSPGVKRVSPADVQRGRKAVLAEYQRQFDVDTIQAYRLDGAVATGGQAGRASGRYTVSRRGRPPITGRVALGMERIRGKPLIRLIATEPRS